MYSIAAFADKIIMSEEAVKRYEETKNKGPAELRKQENPLRPQEPIYHNTRDNNIDIAAISSGSDTVKANDTAPVSEQSEPLLKKVQNEKMVYINDRGFPIAENSLTAKEILQRTGFAPHEYTLFAENAHTTPLKEEQRVQIGNNMKLNAILNTRGDQKVR